MKHTALNPRCGGCGSPSCPSCNPDAFLAKADVYAMELVETPQMTATPSLWRITPIRTKISKVISDWLNEYGVDAKAEDLNWKDLEERLTDCFAQSLPLQDKSGPTIARILSSLGHSEDCNVIKCGLDNDDDSCDCERKSLVTEITDAATTKSLEA